MEQYLSLQQHIISIFAVKRFIVSPCILFLPNWYDFIAFYYNATELIRQTDYRNALYWTGILIPEEPGARNMSFPGDGWKRQYRYFE